MGQRCKAKNGEDPGLPPLRDKSVRAWLPKADKHCLMAGQVPTESFKGPVEEQIFFIVFICYKKEESSTNLIGYITTCNLESKK